MGSEGIDESLGLYKLRNLKCFADTSILACGYAPAYLKR